MTSVTWDLLLILGLILANGFFAGAEIAIIAARRGRLKELADGGDRAAGVALDLAEHPNRFLSTVQVGITLVSTFASAFGGARIVTTLSDLLSDSAIASVAHYHEPLALTCVVVGITYFSVLLGELVPKRIALNHAASIARLVALPMHWLSQAARPIVWFMSICTEGVLWLLRNRESHGQDVVIEDIEHLIYTGTQAGVLDPAEQHIALEALRLGELTARDIMQPRLEVDALDVGTPSEQVVGAVAMAGYSRLPIYEEDMDRIVGYIHIKDVLRRSYLGLTIELCKIMRPVLLVPETLPADQLLLRFKQRGEGVAVVLDEFGGTEGIVTLQDVLDELVGEIHDGHEKLGEPPFQPHTENGWLVDGSVRVDELLEHLDRKLPEGASRRYSTVAGLVLAQLGHIPQVGDQTAWHGLQIEVLEMAGQRIVRVWITESGQA